MAEFAVQRMQNNESQGTVARRQIVFFVLQHTEKLFDMTRLKEVPKDWAEYIYIFFFSWYNYIVYK